MSHQVLLYHIIFRTKGSICSINTQHERELYAYINGLCTNKDCKLYRIGGMPDHVHMLVSIPPKHSISEFMKVLKVETNRWIRDSHLFPVFTGWGRGYAIFSYSMDEKQSIYNYILHQKEHHQGIDLRGEINRILVANNINPEEDDFFED